MPAGTVRIHSLFFRALDMISPHLALATSWINAGQALRRAQDIGLHAR